MPDQEPIDPSRAEYVYVQLADHIAKQVSVGRLKVGAMLAGERALAVEYGLAVGTVRRAIALLRERGEVVTLPGKGTFITEPPVPPEDT